MYSHTGGFSLLATTILLSLLGITLCTAVALRVNDNMQTIQQMQAHQKLKNEVDHTTAKQLNKINAAKSSVAPSKHNIDGFHVSSTVSEQTPMQSSRYNAIYSIKTEAYDSSNTVFAAQSLQLGRFSMLKQLPLDGFTYAANYDSNSLLSPYFGTDNEIIGAFAEYATVKLSSCDQLTIEHVGFIGISDNCSIKKLTIGHHNRPILLVIANTNITLHQTTINGLVIHLCENSNSSIISMDSSRINGALLSTCSNTVPAGLINYDLSILESLLNHSDNSHIEVIAGSWWSQ